jgi:hypothetical protein
LEVDTDEDEDEDEDLANWRWTEIWRTRILQIGGGQKSGGRGSCKLEVDRNLEDEDLPNWKWT